MSLNRKYTKIIYVHGSDEILSRKHYYSVVNSFVNTLELFQWHTRICQDILFTKQHLNSMQNLILTGFVCMRCSESEVHNVKESVLNV